MDLTEHPVEVGLQRQRRDREREVDAIGGEEGELGRSGLVELDRHLVTHRQRSGRGELGHVGIDRDHPGPPSGQADGRVAGTAAELEDALAVRVADEPALEGWTIYLDINRNGLFDADTEPSQVTAADGSYHFAVVGSPARERGHYLVVSTPSPYSDSGEVAALLRDALTLLLPLCRA